MKIRTLLIILLLYISNSFSNEIKEEQIKVAYVYNFLKNISWENEKELKKYRLLIVSKNETLKNMFLMLASRKQLKDKNLEIVFYDNKKSNNLQAIFIDNTYRDIYEKLFFNYEKENVLFISDEYQDKKQVMINLLQSDTKITFEINKANILNRSLQISPNLILLGGTEIDVAKLYKSSQDELKEQKDKINILNQNIEDKNFELNSKINAINEQKSIISTQTKNIKSYENKITNQTKLLAKQVKQIDEQKLELNNIYKNIELEKKKLQTAVEEVKQKEDTVKELVKLQEEKQLEFEKTKTELENLNSQIEVQKDNLLIKEDIISNQKSVIGYLVILFIIIVILGTNVFKQNRLLKKLSQTDTLSGLFNRRVIIEKLDEEISKYNRYKTSFSLLLIDIDYFKKINDKYGHDKGDFVIKKLSNLMLQNTRTTDICARWGGEEFTILVPNSNNEEALILSEKLRKIVEEYFLKIKLPVTISIGVATFKEDTNQEKLLKLADNALYKAKENGRNRTETL